MQGVVLGKKIFSVELMALTVILMRPAKNKVNNSASKAGFEVEAVEVDQR